MDEVDAVDEVDKGAVHSGHFLQHIHIPRD